MNIRHISRWHIVTALVLVCTGLGLERAVAAPGEPPDTEQGVQVLTRGPVHEAFAETVTFDPQPGMIVTKAPPEAIEELPPEERPEGANVTWIPGYWAWDDEQNNFLWISGIWRALPPSRQWVPGYWGRIERGYQWTSGYWSDATASDVEYLPEPPATIESGPNIAAPSPDYVWVPGSWVWHHHRFAWRPGYWMVGHQNWVWVPSHYIWAPRGYIYSDGYWDYSIARRGVLFAPAYFDAAVYTRRGFHYSPSVVINLGVFSDQLFVRPRYQHYYFGDYYAADYRTRGFYASFSADSRRRGYDPIYTHERWEHRRDHDWDHRVEAEFQHRREHEDARPPRTWATQMKINASADQTRERRLVVGTSLDQLAKRNDSPMKFQRVDNEERKNLTQRRQEVRKFRDEREKVDSRPIYTSADKPVKETESARVKISRSPIVARSSDRFEKNQAPPKRPADTKLNSKIEPKKRSGNNEDRDRRNDKDDDNDRHKEHKDNK